MCGIIAVARRPGDRSLPETAAVLALVTDAAELLGTVLDDADPGKALDTAAARLADADHRLRGAVGVRALLADPGLVAGLEERLAGLNTTLATLDAGLEDLLVDRPTAEQEVVSGALVAVRDGAWALGHDRLRTARAVSGLAGPGAGAPAIEAMTSVQMALSALDRLEVRGRDSAGLTLLVRGHQLDLGSAALAPLVAARRDDPSFGSGSVREADGCLSFVYKAAAEIGELGDNTATLRAAIARDELLASALVAPEAEVLVLGHTRWASVGIISQANAHPVNSDEDGEDPGPYVTAALNGDIDNFADLKVG